MGSRQNARQQLKDVKASVTPATHVIDTQSATRPAALVPQVTTVGDGDDVRGECTHPSAG